MTVYGGMYEFDGTRWNLIYGNGITPITPVPLEFPYDFPFLLG